MIEVIKVKTKKQQKQFVKFPLELYKNNKYYVPALQQDEISLFSKKNANRVDSDIEFFLAYKDGKVAGRIAGIEQKTFNKINNETRCRFSRFDCINDLEVAKALFNAVENWAKEKGLNVMHGPLGFNDLEREGLLIEGFDQLATFEENYNFEYYKDLIEQCGYAKETDYLAFQIIPPKNNDRIKNLSNTIFERYNLHLAPKMSMSKFLNKYQDQLFDVIDEAYKPLYGVVPLNKEVRKSIVLQFKLLLNMDCICTVLDSNDNVVGFGMGLPSLAKAVQKSNGKYLPFGIFRMLKARKNFKLFDFALIGVRSQYQGLGITAIILQYLIDKCNELGVEIIETNQNLETNNKILLTWKNFEHKQHKRYRCFIKSI